LVFFYLPLIRYVSSQLDKLFTSLNLSYLSFKVGIVTVNVLGLSGNNTGVSILQIMKHYLLPSALGQAGRRAASPAVSAPELIATLLTSHQARTLLSSLFSSLEQFANL
jgi:hypothetical protein